MKALVAQWCLTLGDLMDCSVCPRSSPGKNAGVSCHALLQGIFPIQESGLWLLHWQEDSLPLEPPGKLIICRRHWLSREHVLASRDRAQGCCQHPTVRRTDAPTEKHLAPNVSGTQAEKPSCNLRVEFCVLLWGWGVCWGLVAMRAFLELQSTGSRAYGLQ